MWIGDCGPTGEFVDIRNGRKMSRVRKNVWIKVNKNMINGRRQSDWQRKRMNIKIIFEHSIHIHICS